MGDTNSGHPCRLFCAVCPAPLEVFLCRPTMVRLLFILASMYAMSMLSLYTSSCRCTASVSVSCEEACTKRHVDGYGAEQETYTDTHKDITLVHRTLFCLRGVHFTLFISTLVTPQCLNLNHDTPITVHSTVNSHPQDRSELYTLPSKCSVGGQVASVALDGVLLQPPVTTCDCQQHSLQN